MKKVKYALVQSGGGFKGTFQLGALNYLNEHWKEITGTDTPMKFDIITGVSVGALNGAMLAMNKLNELNELWLEQVAKNGASEIYTSEFLDTENQAEGLKMKLNLKSLVKRLIPSLDVKLKFFEKLGLIFSSSKRKTIIEGIINKVEKEVSSNLSKINAIADNLPLRRKLEKLIDRSLIQGVFKCGFVSLNTGTYHSVKHTDFLTNQEFVNGIIASTSMPVVWKPVDSVKFRNSKGQIIDSRNNVDGGVMNVAPLGDAIRLINDDSEDCIWRIIVINCHSGVPTIEDYSNKSITQIAARSIYELTLGEIFNNDLEHFTEINKIVEQARAWDYEIVLYNTLKQVIKQFEAVIINPSTSFDMGNPLLSSKELIKQRFEHGYKVAATKRYFK